MNFGLQHVHEEIYIGIDADTVIAPDAITKLIARMADPAVGAVAGNAKVGNRINLWTRWQALEYITSQNFDRRALDLFDVVTVVPGAIGAWRTAAVKAAEGYHVNTVAEDADLTMSLLQQGLKVVYEDRAFAFTEAPDNMRGLMRQRFRWSFGILQAVVKHRGAFLRHRAMSLFALPNMIAFQIILPLFSPFIDLIFIAGAVHYAVDRHFHPEAASTASFEKLIVYFLVFLVVDFLASSLAFLLEPRHPSNKGDGWLLFHIWIQRFTYRQVFSLVLLKTIKRAIDGRPFAWEKQVRTARLSASTKGRLWGTKRSIVQNGLRFSCLKFVRSKSVWTLSTPVWRCTAGRLRLLYTRAVWLPWNYPPLSLSVPPRASSATSRFWTSIAKTMSAPCGTL